MKVKGDGDRMSLSIFLREKKDELNKYKIVKDVEANFSKVRLGEHKEDERILSQIEKATIVNCNAFIDRFGFKLDSGFLSTGCKAALEVVRCGEEEIIDVYVKLSKNVMESIIDGRMTFQRAFMTGEMTAKGNFKTLRMLDQIFPF